MMLVVAVILDSLQLVAKAYFMLMPVSVPLTVYLAAGTGSWMTDMVLSVGVAAGLAFATPVLPFVGIGIAYPITLLTATFALLLFPLWFTLRGVNLIEIVLKHPWHFFIHINEFLPFLSVLPAITMNVHKVISVSRKEDTKKFKEAQKKTKENLKKVNRALVRADKKESEQEARAIREEERAMELEAGFA